MNSKLIIDVGMHTGRDTEFYLRKGFDVVAVEANPELVRLARLHFRDALATGKLVLYGCAVTDYDGEIDFYVNSKHDDWGTTSNEFALRNELLGTDNKLIRVNCIRFQNILMQHGIPYYLKIDIEGSDILCLKALKSFNDRPKYVSIEADFSSFENACSELTLLLELGYNKFKIVNQELNSKVRCHNPPLEGFFTDYCFDGTCSGPFGEESPGRWMAIEETMAKSRILVAEQRYFGASGRFYRTFLHKMYEVIKREPVGWYDIHAKLAGS